MAATSKEAEGPVGLPLCDPIHILNGLYARLAGRILALVETGTIQHPDDYANFAHAL